MESYDYDLYNNPETSVNINLDHHLIQDRILITGSTSMQMIVDDIQYNTKANVVKCLKWLHGVLIAKQWKHYLSWLQI